MKPTYAGYLEDCKAKFPHLFATKTQARKNREKARRVWLKKNLAARVYRKARNR